MTEILTTQQETLLPSYDMRFAVACALEIGRQMVAGREAELEVSAKLDRALVTNIDVATNVWFNGQVDGAYGGRAAVRGEEVSQDATQDSGPDDERIVWVLDSLDGTGEYVATHRDRRTKDPINPLKPLSTEADVELIPDDERSTCTGVAMLKNGQLWLSAVHNPFKRELVVADRDLGGSFIIDIDSIDETTMRGQRLEVRSTPFIAGESPWDEAVWDGGAVDTTLLHQAAATQPLGTYSAIGQAVDVVLGKSVGAVFAGDTIHDIAPAAAIVHSAGGIVAKPDGRLVDLDNIDTELSGGIVYTNVLGHVAFMRALQKGERSNLCLVDHDGVRFKVPFSEMLGGIPPTQRPDEIVRYATTPEGEQRTDEIIVSAFGFYRGDWVTEREAKVWRRTTDEAGAPRWTYKNERHANGRMTGRAHIENPDQLVTVPTGPETSREVRASDLVISVLRSFVSYKIRRSAEQYLEQHPEAAFNP